MDDVTAALVAAQDGDPRAFERFVQLTRADVTRLCRYLGDTDNADDLIQDTYLRSLRSLGNYHHDAPARAWLLTIARRVCIDAVRQRTRARRTNTPPTPLAVPDHSAATTLTMLIDELPADQRHALVLTQLLGLSYDDTATICDCPVGTIRSRVARARTTLAGLIEHAEHAG